MEADEEPPTPPPAGFMALWQTKPPPPLEGHIGFWSAKAQPTRPVSAPLMRRPVGLVLGPVPPRINPSVWDAPPEPAGPPPVAALKDVQILANEMPVPGKTSPGPLITSVSSPDQVVDSMLVKIDESVRGVDPAMFLQAHQLVQQRVPS